MANIAISPIYGQNFLDQPAIQGMFLQFHITVQCDQNCIHCYMFNTPSYKDQLKNSLSKSEMYELFDQYREFFTEFNTFGGISITGGDPILSPYFWDVIEYIDETYPAYNEISILGNSYHITPEIAHRLRENSVTTYQISIDGLEKTHDYFRKEGSFQDALRGLRILHNEGIRTVVSFTLSKLNAADLVPLMEFLDGQKYIDSFGFDRLTPMGNASNDADEMFDPKEYQEFLFNVFKHEILENPRIISFRKEKLWRLLFAELGLTDPFDSQTSRILSGCSAGLGTLAVLADGTVYTCRRLEIPAGKFPQKTIKDIFINNPVTAKLRNVDKYEGCNICPLRAYCRGCIATKFAMTDDLYARDPLCWRI